MPSVEYVLDEAARFRGYTQSSWEAEPATCKARVLAHYLEHGLREAFMMEEAERAAKNDKPVNPADVDFFKFRQGVKPN